MKFVPILVHPCINQQCERMIWDRDVNAAINILTLGILRLKCFNRPEEFSRMTVAVS